MYFVAIILEVIFSARSVSPECNGSWFWPTKNSQHATGAFEERCSACMESKVVLITLIGLLKDREDGFNFFRCG